MDDEQRGGRGGAPSRLEAVMAKLGKLIVNDERAEEVVRSNRQAAALKRRNELGELLAREGIPLTDDVRDAFLNGKQLAPTQSVLAIERWLYYEDHVPPVLVLSGPTGSGKSVAAAHALVRKNRPCKWRQASAVLRAFASWYGEAAAEQDRLKRCSVLVIDDVGTEQDAARFSVALLELLEARKQASVFRTIITTNLTAEDFAARYVDERLQSRLSPRCAAWVTVTDPDLRKVKLPNAVDAIGGAARLEAGHDS